MPTQATPESAGLCLYTKETVEIIPHARFAVSTSIKIKIPIYICGQIALINQGVEVVPGIIEQGDTSEVQIEVINNGDLLLKVTLYTAHSRKDCISRPRGSCGTIRQQVGVMT